jgi:hypothetical protein
MSFSVDDDTCLTYEKIMQEYVSIHTPFFHMGIMFLNKKTGERSIVVNPNYEELKNIRGNHPNIQYQYLCLRKINKILDFLNFFPQYKEMFYQFMREYEQLVTNIHSSYISYYVKKDGQKISGKYFPHIYKIHHQIFLPSLQNTKIVVKKAVVREYLSELDPGDILHLLNYQKREYYLFEKSQQEQPIA